MIIRIGKKRAWSALLYFGIALGLTLGCNKDKDKDKTNGNPPPGPPGGMPGGPPGGPGGRPGMISPHDVLAKLPGGEEFAAGKKVYADNNCARCHKLGETGGMMMGGPPMHAPGGPPGAPGQPGQPGQPGMHPGGPPGAGPDLTMVGTAPEHTKQWLAEHIRDAKMHKPESRMPPFGMDKISDADLTSLAEYLASRK